MSLFLVQSSWISDMIVTFRNPVTGRSLPSNVREAQIQGLSLAGTTRLAGLAEASLKGEPVGFS